MTNIKLAVDPGQLVQVLLTVGMVKKETPEYPGSQGYLSWLLNYLFGKLSFTKKAVPLHQGETAICDQKERTLKGFAQCKIYPYEMISKILFEN